MLLLLAFYMTGTTLFKTPLGTLESSTLQTSMCFNYRSPEACLLNTYVNRTFDSSFAMDILDVIRFQKRA